MTRGQHVVLIVAAVATAAVSPVSAQSVAPTLACVAPPDFARFDTPLKRVAERISAQQPLTIVAIGSSSTFYNRCYRLVIDLWRGRKLTRDVLSEPTFGRAP